MALDDDDIIKWAESLSVPTSTPSPKSSPNRRAEALRKAADSLGVDAADLGSIISFETGGTFDPHKVGGEGNKYKGLIQFGPDEQRKYYRPNDTFETQLEKGVVPYFQDRFKKVGKDTRGASLEDLYTTVIAGNPKANRNAKDSFGTSAKSGTQRIAKEHRPNVLKSFFGGQETRVSPGDVFDSVDDAVDDGVWAEVDSVLQPKSSEKPLMAPPKIGSPISPTNPSPTPYRSGVPQKQVAEEPIAVPSDVTPAPPPPLPRLGNQVLGEAPTETLIRMVAPPQAVQPPVQPVEQPSPQQRPSQPAQRPVVRKNRTAPVVKESLPTERPSDDIALDIGLADKPASQTYTQWVEGKQASALADRLGVDYETVKTVLDAFGSPTVGKSANQADEDYYAGLAKQGDANRVTIGGNVVRAIKETDAKNKQRKADFEAKLKEHQATLEPGAPASLAGIRAAFEIGLISPEEMIRRVAEEKDLAKRLRTEVIGYETTATAIPGVDDPAKLEANRKAREDKYLESILKTYPTLKDYKVEQDRLKSKYKYRPLAHPIEFAKNFYGAVPKAVASILKSGDIALSLNPLKLGADAVRGKGYAIDETVLTEIGDGINKYIESARNKDLKDNLFVTMLPDTLGQLATQIAAGVVTGGASVPTAIGASMGAAAQYDEAKKFKATDQQKLLASVTGALAAVPDAILFSKWFKAADAAEQTGFFKNLTRSVMARLGVKYGDEVAEAVTKDAMLAFTKNIVKGSLGEGIQEVSENKINDWVASVSYDPSETRKKKLFSITDEDVVSFLGGLIGGGTGGAVQTLTENIADEAKPDLYAQSLGKVDEMLEKGEITPEIAATIKKTIAQAADDADKGAGKGFSGGAEVEPKANQETDKATLTLESKPDSVSPLDTPEKRDIWAEIERIVNEEDPDLSLTGEGGLPINQKDYFAQNETNTEIPKPASPVDAVQNVPETKEPALPAAQVTDKTVTAETPPDKPAVQTDAVAPQKSSPIRDRVKTEAVKYFPAKASETVKEPTAKAETKKPKIKSVSQVVRQLGDIKSSKWDSGEGKRISNRETGSSGLINNKSGVNAEKMAGTLWDMGYLRDVFPTRADVDGNVLMSIIEDDVTGVRKHYAQADHEEFDRSIEEQEREYREKTSANDAAAEAYRQERASLVDRQAGVLRDPEVQKVLAKMDEEPYSVSSDGFDLPKNENSRQFQDLLEKHGISYDFARDIIEAYAAERPSEEDVAGSADNLDQGSTQASNEPARQDPGPLKATAFDQVDLFGNKTTPKTEQRSMFDAAPESVATDDISKTIADLKARKGNEAIIRNAEDAHEVFQKARRTQSSVDDMLRQQTLEGKTVAETIDPQAVEFAKAMEKGDFRVKLRKARMQPESKQANAVGAENFQDFGEKIGGAKKDIGRDLESITSKDLATEPLSKAFPRPDYATLVRDGLLTVDAAKALSFLYDNIPAKPRKAYKVAGWVKQVESVIEAYRNSLGGVTDSATRFIEDARKRGFATLADGFEVYSEWLDVNNFPESKPPAMGAYKLKKFTKWNKEGDGATAYSIIKNDRYIIKDFPTAKEAAEALKQMLESPAGVKATEFSVYQDRSTKDFFIGKKGASGVVRLITGLEDVKAARAYITENQAQLEQMWEARKYKQGVERKDTDEETRIAKDWRNGKDIASTEEFAKAFGFRGVEFGNWVKQGASKNERQQAINDSYDALMDLADLLKIDPKALSLNGSLGLALGARGSGNASAHYEPTKVVINLTKTRGKGSLGHEWWHALDNYFAKMRGEKGGYVTDFPHPRNVKESGMFVKDTRVREELLAGYDGVVKAIRASELPKRSRNMDATRSSPYWSTMVEMTARSFENYIVTRLADKGQRNDFLSNFRDMADWGKTGFDADAFPYPLAAEQDALNKAFDELFETMEQEETDQGNVILRKARTPADLDELKALSESSDFSAIIPKIKSSVDGNTLSLGTMEASEAVRTLLSFALNTSRESQPLLEGLFLEPKNVASLSEAADAFADVAEENDVDAKPLRKLIANIEKASKKNGTVKLHVFDDALEHESVHESSYLGADGKTFEKRYANADELKKDPVFQKFHKELNKINGVSSHGVAMEEALAYLTNGDFARFGLTEDEANEIVATLVEGYAAANGVESLKYFDNTKAYEAIELYRQSQRREAGNERRGKLSGERETGPGEATGESEKGDPREREKAPAGQKVASFSRILGTDYFYDPQTHEETEARAQQLLSDKGTEQAVWEALNGKPSAETMRVVYWELERLNGLADHYLESKQNEAYNAVAEEIADLSAKIVARQVKGGQEIEIAKTLVSLSPEVAILAATKMKKFADGDPDATLSPDQTKQIIEIAKLLKESNKKLAEANVKLRANERKIKRLESDKEPTRRTPQSRLLKEYQAKKPALIAKLKEAFPNSPMFNGEESALKMVANTLGAFDKWFKKSKVVDEAGKPLVVYHGTAQNFDAFDPAVKPLTETVQPGQQGFFFTPDQGFAEGYAASAVDHFNYHELPHDGERVVAAYLSLQNPLEISVEGDAVTWFDSQPLSWWSDTVLGKGHDGAIIRGEIEDPMYIAAKPEQIKSVENSGTFDENDASILRSVAPTPLDPEQVQLLTEYAAGMILEGRTYDEVIQTLTDIAGTDVRDVHAKAVEMIRSSRPVSDEAKERLKIRNEHYAKAKKFTKPDISGIAQDAEAMGQSKELIFAIDRLTGDKPKNINDVVRDLREEFGLTVHAATDLAREADALVREIKKTRREEADAAREITPELRKELNAAKIAKARATYRLNKFLNQLANKPWLMERFNNDFRAKLVSNWGTQIFNAVQGVLSTTTESVIDLMEATIKTVANPNPETTLDINAKDAWLPLAYVFSNNKQIGEQALAEFPEEYYKVHSGLLGDIELDTPKLAPDAHTLTKPLHFWFDKMDVLNKHLSKISGAKMQEMHFRNAIVASSFDQVIRKKSGGTETLKSAIDNGTILKYVTEQDAKLAADKALRVTFASMIDDPIGRQLKRGYDKLDKVLPVMLNPVTFARFTYTTTKVMVANPLLMGLLDTQTLGGGGYNSRSIAKAVLGWSGVALAYGVLSAFGDDDDRWETLTIDGKTFDIRRFFPMSSYFYVAHLIKSQVEGRPAPSPKELLEGFASLETDYFRYGAPWDMAVTTYEATQGRKSMDDVGAASSRVLGSYFSGWLRFLKPAKDVLAQFDDDEATFRDYSDTAREKFIQEISKTLPVVGRSAGKIKTDAVTGEPVVARVPLGRMMGINIVHPSFLSAKQTPATEWAEKLFVYTPTGEWTEEAKQAFYIRKRLKQAVYRKEVTPKELEARIQQFVKEGRLTERSASTLRKDLLLSELQFRLKYGYKPGPTPNPAMDRKLDRVMKAATDEEKKDIEATVGKRMKTREKVSP